MKFKFSYYSIIILTFFLLVSPIWGEYLSNNELKKQTGTIVGTVVDFETGEILYSANIMIEGTNLGAIVGKNGRFVINKAPIGKITIVARYLGYREKKININVKAEQTTEIRFELKPTLIDLNEVVVAGSVVEVKKKTAPNPVTIIGKEKFENMPVKDLSELLNGYVPGSYKSELIGGTRVGLRGLSGLGAKIKIYVDGIHVAGNSDIGVDFRNVEKVEVLRGPQATTLYGSGAAGGVILITTKKNKKSGLNLTFNNSLTVVKKNYYSEVPVERDHHLTLANGTGDVSYLFSIRNINSEPIFKNNGINDNVLLLNGNTKIKIGDITAVLSGGYSKSKHGSSVNPLMAQREIEKNYFFKFFGLLLDKEHLFTTKSLNLNLNQTITSNWFHSLYAGFADSESESNTLSLITPTSSYKYSKSNSTEYNIKYISSYGRNFNNFSMQLSGGFEYVYGKRTHQGGEFKEKFTTASGAVPTTSSFSYADFSNTGYFIEGLWGYADKLFLTTAVRFEDHESYGENTGLVASPRIGLTYTVDTGWLVFKPRVSYGQATNPPSPVQKLGRKSISNNYINETLPNPELKPSRQYGYEFGGDFYLGDNLTLEVTYYNQDVKDAISYETVKEEPGLHVGQNQNIGTIENKGWEFVTNMKFGDVKIYGTLTLTDSRSESIYKNFGNDNVVPYLPKKTATLSVDYKFPRWLSINKKRGSITLEWRYQGEMKGDNALAIADRDFGGIMADFDRYITYGGYSKYRVRANLWITDFLQFYVDGRNLSNKQNIDGNNSAVTKGRNIAFGCYLQF